MAKYENGLWYFAKSVDAQNGGAITWSETGMQGSKIDENAGDINVNPAKEVATCKLHCVFILLKLCLYAIFINFI